MTSRKNTPSGITCKHCGLEIQGWRSGWRHIRNQHSAPSCGRAAEPARIALKPYRSGVPDRWLHDAEWARVGSFTIYPRDDRYFIGRPSGAREYCDVDVGFDGGFANIEAAIDHARRIEGKRE